MPGLGVQITVVVYGGFAVQLIAGALALRHLRRVARPEEPKEQQSRLSTLAWNAFLLNFALGVMSFLFYILLSIVVAPVLPHQGLLVRPSAFTPQLQAVWFAVNGMFLMAISVPFFVGVAAHVLDLKPGIGSLNLVKATRFALANSSYFIYWGLTWITWTLIAALRLLLLRALSIPLFPPRTNPTWTLIEIAVYVAALFPMAQFIGLWARRAMPPGSRSASAVTAADHAGGSRGLDVEQADQLDSGHWR